MNGPFHYAFFNSDEVVFLLERNARESHMERNMGRYKKLGRVLSLVILREN